MGIFIFWVILAFIVGMLGSDRRIGFFGALVVSILLSPLIGLIITMMSKRVSDEIIEYETKLSIDYANYLNARNSNPEAFTLEELIGNEQYVQLESPLIPNSEIGKPIYIAKYHSKENKQMKQGKRVLQLRMGNKVMDFQMPYDGTFKKIHNVNSFLKPDDMLYKVSERN